MWCDKPDVMQEIWAWPLMEHKQAPSFKTIQNAINRFHKILKIIHFSKFSTASLPTWCFQSSIAENWLQLLMVGIAPQYSCLINAIKWPWIIPEGDHRLISSWTMPTTHCCPDYTVLVYCMIWYQVNTRETQGVGNEQKSSTKTFKDRKVRAHILTFRNI